MPPLFTSDLSRGAVPRRHQGLPHGAAERPVCGLLPGCLRLQSVLRLQRVGDGALCHAALDEPGLPGRKGQWRGWSDDWSEQRE